MNKRKFHIYRWDDTVSSLLHRNSIIGYTWDMAYSTKEKIYIIRNPKITDDMAKRLISKCIDLNLEEGTTLKYASL